MRTLLLVVSFCFGMSVFGFGQEETAPRVLFIGNSYTYFWNLPQTVGAMATAMDVPLITRQSTAGGVNLGQHWRGEKELNTQSLIRQGDFDAVILQDHSMRAIEYPDSLLHFGQLFGELAKEEEAKTYIYMTWARQWDPYMQAPIAEQYTRLAEQLDANLIPVGLAWERSRALRPELPLFDPDGSHPSPTGTYLTACVVFGKLTGMSPIGLPHRLTVTDANGEKLYLNIQSRQDALFCQKVAEEVLNAVLSE